MVFSRKILLLTLLVFTFGCGKKKNVDTIDPRVLNAFELIEKGFFLESERILKQVKDEKPDDCYASWGMVFVSFNKVLEVINSIISILSGFVDVGFSPRFDILSDLKERNLSDIVSLAILPILSPTDEISKNISVIDAKKCFVNVSFPFVLGSRSLTLTKSRLGNLRGDNNLWGPTEAALFGGISNILAGMLKFILVINLDLNLSKLIDLQFRTDINSLVSFGSTPVPQDILRGVSSQQISFLTSALSFNVYDTAIFFASLAYIVEVSPEFLKLKPGSERNIDEVAEQFSRGFNFLMRSLDYIPVYSNEKTIIGYKDIGKKGLSADDDIFLNIYNEEGEQGLFVKLGNFDLKVDGILSSLVLKPLVNPDVNKKIYDFFSIFSKAIDINNPNIKEEERWVDLSIFSYVIPLIEIPSTIRFSPKNFLEGLKKNPEGLRAILPIWSDLNYDGFPEFLVEAESRQLESKFCFKKEDRNQKFVISPPYISVDSLPSTEKKRIRIVTSRVSYNTDFFCYLNHDIKRDGEGFSLYIDSSIFVRGLDMKTQRVEMSFDVFDCDSYVGQKYFICFRKSGISSYNAYAFIEKELYPIVKIFSDDELLEIFQKDLLRSYSTHVTTNVVDSCFEELRSESKSYKGVDYFKLKICDEKVYSIGSTYFSARAQFDYDSCFHDFNNLYFLFPFYFSPDGLLSSSNPNIFLSKGELSTNALKSLSIGQSIGDHEKAIRYITENLSVVKNAQRFKIFSLFFTDPDVIRVETIGKFPLYSYIVLGCSAILPRCFYAEDSPHFPPKVISQGIPLSVNIKNDCMFPDGDWSYYYVAFRDPTFYNSIRVNVKNIGKSCVDDPDGWVEPDQYLMNKVFADLLQRTFGPILSVIARILGIITGTYQDISQGENCD